MVKEAAVKPRWLAFFEYVAAGVYLNRGVLRNLIEWHPPVQHAL